MSELEIDGLLLIEPPIYRDLRGTFRETWNARRFAKWGIELEFVQDNISCSGRGVLRGLHYQHPQGQAKLTSVVHGEVWDVAVDIRQGSASFGRWVGVHLSAENGRQLLIPDGFAHGFVVLSDVAVFSYKCSRYYDSKVEWTIRWDDPQLGIDWPVADPILSSKDRMGHFLQDVPNIGIPRSNSGS